MSVRPNRLPAVLSWLKISPFPNFAGSVCAEQGLITIKHERES
jgi:hypothetical protein